jgi:hypothetical protein
MSKRLWLVVAVIALGGAGWMYGRGLAIEPTLAATVPAPEPPPLAAETSVASASAPMKAAPIASAASAPTKPPPARPFPGDSSADLLRKVQLGFGSGSAQDAQEAANVLQFCLHAAKAADGLQFMRDNGSLVSAAITKLMKSLGAGDITNEQIDQAQGDGRRCQVFDEATLARRGELLQKAYEGGAQGGAMSYLTWLATDGKADADPAVLEKLRAEVRESARSGDFGALAPFAFMVDGQPYGISRAEREAYKQAWLRIAEDGSPGNAASSRQLIATLERFSRLPALTADEQREADALAQQVYDAYHRRSTKRE